MSDERATFMRAICENPEDDTVRLVFADWLEEHGEGERAEFIRDCVQVLAKHTDCPRRLEDVVRGRPVPLRCGRCDYCQARQRAEKVYHRISWFPGNYAVCFEPTPLDFWMPTGPGPTLVVSRGFVSHILCTAEDWLAHADAIFWSPRQTVECKRCRGTGMVEDSHGYTEFSHGACDGTGRIPRPFPPTAQPITEVTLTTEPHERDFGTIDTFDHGKRIAMYFSWPGITFRLPTV